MSFYIYWKKKRRNQNPTHIYINNILCVFRELSIFQDNMVVVALGIFSSVVSSL